MINLIIMRNLTFTDMSQEYNSYSYSYPKETNMKISREVSVPESLDVWYKMLYLQREIING